ncbi:hypothetical protein Pfo_004716 [Paulownia fortunei]|nr:hypothetical protein Pfo_004716 [Paulownia fortunei]
MNKNNSEMDKKRKIDSQDLPIPRKYPPADRRVEENQRDMLTLTLSTFQHHPTTVPHNPSPVHHHPQPLPPPPPPLLPSPPRPTLSLPSSSHSLFLNTPLIAVPLETAASPSTAVAGHSRPRRSRRNPSKTPPEGKSVTISPPFPWSTNRRATVHGLNYLLSKQISSISGDVQCKRCERQYTMEFDLQQKLMEIGSFIAENKASMHHRAPKIWLNPTLPGCRFCEQENSVRPVICDKKRSINWLFLLLGQMLGCCTLDQLKYFCKHTKNHRTGAKDRVLYLTYLGLCRQLDPNGPFDI